ncbi:hypothetical protein MDAP_000841 [Mitosporidium daphniae]
MISKIILLLGLIFFISSSIFVRGRPCEPKSAYKKVFEGCEKPCGDIDIVLKFVKNNCNEKKDVNKKKGQKFDTVEEYLDKFNSHGSSTQGSTNHDLSGNPIGSGTCPCMGSDIPICGKNESKTVCLGIGPDGEIQLPKPYEESRRPI